MDPMFTTLIILALCFGMMIWQRIPMALTALLTQLALILTGVLTPEEGFSSYSNSSVLLISGIIVIGQAFFETGLAQDTAIRVMKVAHTRKALIALIVLCTGTMSAFLSNTGITALMIPVVGGICYKTGIRRSKLMMPISIAASVGGTMTLVGTVVNVMANTTLEGFGYAERFTFFEFTKLGLPVLIITALYCATLGDKLMPDRQTEFDGNTARVLDFSHVPTWKRRAVLLVMFAVFLGMLCEPWLHIGIHVIAIIGAGALVLVGVFSEEQAYRAINLRTIFLLAGILPLATAVEKTGAGSAVANAIVRGIGSNPNPLLLVFVLFFVSAILTQFMNNTAAAAVLCPIGLSVSSALGANPKSVILVIVAAASYAYCMPFGTPPNILTMFQGGYTFSDYMKVGFPLLAITCVAVMVIVPIFWPMFS